MISPLLGVLTTRSLWICVLYVVFFEVVLRVSVPERLVPRGNYHNIEMRLQVEDYLNTARVDGLFLGSSVAAANFPPVSFDNRLAELGMSEFVSFNGGIRGCNYDCIAAGALSYYLADRIPPYVFLVISPEDLDEGNKAVIKRSLAFMATFDEAEYRKWIKRSLASLSYLYGLQGHVRSLLKSGDWGMDSSVVRVRGHVDMGSGDMKRFYNAPVVSDDSHLANALRHLTEVLVAGGSRVILIPAEGDTDARRLLSEESRRRFYQLLHSLAMHHQISLLDESTGDFAVEDYIDNLHLNTNAAHRNAVRLADLLIGGQHLP